MDPRPARRARDTARCAPRHTSPRAGRAARATLVAALAACALHCSEPSPFADVPTRDDVAAEGAGPMDAPSDFDATAPDGVAPDVAAPPDAPDDAATPPPDAEPPLDAADADAGPPPVSVIVYAHTASELYGVDPRTFAITLIGAFGWPSDGHMHEMTDIAVTGAGEIWGVTFDALYRVDRASAACTTVAGLGTGFPLFNGLSFLPAAMPGGAERLVAATRNGDYVEIDTTSGATRRIGTYSGGYGSSGDIVSVAGAGTFATVAPAPFGGTEYLARVDEASGATTLIGPTGVSSTWGLGYWGGTLYGFTESGQFVTIDVATGHATVVSTAARNWWGAGVTTRAPITHL